MLFLINMNSLCQIMTYPERANRHNIAMLRRCIVNGPDCHPGANFIRNGADNSGFVKSLSYGDRQVAAMSLKIGDIVERHMQNDDIVLFNRQPSLHKMSIMSHRVKVIEIIYYIQGLII